jgi:hypothetical protein
MAARRLRLRELIHRLLVGFVFLETGNSFPGYHGQNDANANAEFPLLVVHKYAAHLKLGGFRLRKR